MSQPDMALDAFQTLHTARIKGVLAWSSDDPDAAVARLAEAGLLQLSPRGALLTELGLEMHARLLRDEQDATDLDRIRATYDRFLSVNAPVKAACTEWQHSDGEADAFVDVTMRLDDYLTRVRPALARAAGALPRFAAYLTRLTEAIQRTHDGDTAYVTDLGVDSFHTVWFECHEDYLVTLGLSREHDE